MRAVFNFFKFPAGEVHCKVETLGNFVFENIEKDENLSDYLFRVFMALSTPGAPKRLILPYLAYSRQDRPTSIVEPFSLKVLGKLLNTFNLEEVLTFDVHSDVAFGCVDNLRNFGIEAILRSTGVLESHKDFTLVIPDNGALKKLDGLPFKDQVIGRKHRDTSTGRLEFRGIDGDVHGKNCLIVDDICDGGGTFIMLSKALYEAGASSVELFVTHGIFSKGLQVLLDSGIRKVYTTDSFFQEEEEVKTVFNLRRLIV